MSLEIRQIINGKIAAIYNKLATNQNNRPHVNYTKNTNLASHLYLTTQIKQTNDLLKKLESQLGEDLNKLQK